MATLGIGASRTFRMPTKTGISLQYVVNRLYWALRDDVYAYGRLANLRFKPSSRPHITLKTRNLVGAWASCPLYGWGWFDVVFSTNSKVCAKYNDENRDSLVRSLCYHEPGHGLMYTMAQDISRPLLQKHVDRLVGHWGLPIPYESDVLEWEEVGVEGLISRVHKWFIIPPITIYLPFDVTKASLIGDPVCLLYEESWDEYLAQHPTLTQGL